VKIGESNIMKN